VIAYDRWMFAMLHGGYPVTRPEGDDPELLERAVTDVLREQVAAGLTLLADGGLRTPDILGATLAGLSGIATADRPGASPRVVSLPTWERPGLVPDWRATAELTDLPVKARLVGPYSLGRLLDRGRIGRRRLTLALAAALNRELASLAQAGCPFVQVEEDEAIRIGPNRAERALFKEAQQILLDRLPDAAQGFHRNLAISGGNADTAGPATFYEAPWESHFFDLIEGPDNWRLITRAPTSRGIVCGAVDVRDPRIDDKELIIWAASYAASGGRGFERVGVAPAGSLAGLERSIARRKLERLGESVRIVEARHETPIQAQLDPRAVDSRSAALGRWTPPSELPPRRRP
jgi:methionine synthase II (cobalamin-independent)